MLALLCSLTGCGAGVLPSVHSEGERLTVAQKLAARGDDASAIELLKIYIANNIGSAEVDHAIYLLGQCYLSAKEWPSASAEFERLLREYPESDSSAAASFKLGEAFFGQSRREDFDQEFTLKAAAQWESYLRAFPGNWLNAEAQRRLVLAHIRLATKLVNTGNLYFKLRQAGPARIYYQRAIDEYPDTPTVGDAEVGLALCEAREGKREAAIERLKQVETQYAGRAVAARAARERARLQH